MNKVLFFAAVIITTVFAADDSSKNDKRAQIEQFLKEHPEFRYVPRTARKVNLFEGVQIAHPSDQELNNTFSQMNIKKDNQE
jgi:hypothetical protein